jgi:hypothetical protein
MGHRTKEVEMRRIPTIVLALPLLGMLACERSDGEAPAEQALTGDEAKIAEAESAAPAVIARNATIMDWPETEDGEMRMLRQGTNNWVCFPSTPQALAAAAGEDPMCVDEAWQGFAEAWVRRTEPNVTGLGIAYMLRGDIGASNTDPYATGQTPDNEWVVTPPHIMIIVPNPGDLDALPHDPASGGPFVMWRGTPYAHIMVPVQR